MAAKRGRETVRDMVISLAVVGAFMAFTLAFTLRSTPEAIKVIDTAPVIAAIQQVAPFDTLTPQSLTDWRATSARTAPAGSDPFTWHLGYITPADEYAAVGQTNDNADDYLDDERAVGRPIGTATIDGLRWQKLDRADGQRRSLVLTRVQPVADVASGRTVEQKVTTLVTGSAEYDELTQLASSLVLTPSPLLASKR